MTVSRVLTVLALWLAACGAAALAFTGSAQTALATGMVAGSILLMLARYGVDSRNGIVACAVFVALCDVAFTHLFVVMLEQYNTGQVRFPPVICVAMMAGGAFFALLMLIPALKR